MVLQQWFYDHRVAHSAPLQRSVFYVFGEQVSLSTHVCAVHHWNIARTWIVHVLGSWSHTYQLYAIAFGIMNMQMQWFVWTKTRVYWMEYNMEVCNMYIWWWQVAEFHLAWNHILNNQYLQLYTANCESRFQPCFFCAWLGPTPYDVIDAR